MADQTGLFRKRGITVYIVRTSSSGKCSDPVGTCAHFLTQCLHILWDKQDSYQKKHGTDFQRPHADEQNCTAQSDLSRKYANEQRRTRRTNVRNEIFDSQCGAAHFGWHTTTAKAVWLLACASYLPGVRRNYGDLTADT